MTPFDGGFLFLRSLVNFKFNLSACYFFIHSQLKNMWITPGYEWTLAINAPREWVQLKTIMGTKEVPGKASNPVILSWAKLIGIHDYTNDGIAWCGLTKAYVCHMAERPIIPGPLWALNWAKWGIEVDKGKEMWMDTLVFQRFDHEGKLIGGHVGWYIGEDETHFHVAGGNESDMITIVRIAKERLFACRRAQYINQPIEVKKIYLSDQGVISTNEA
jgi:uncharacterized protein (TIGR02594 family)